MVSDGLCGYFPFFGAVMSIYILMQAFRKAPTEQELANCAMMATACTLVPYCLTLALDRLTNKYAEAALKGLPTDEDVHSGWSRYPGQRAFDRRKPSRHA